MSDEVKRIANISRSETEEMQIAIKEFKGRKYLDMRIFFTTDEGENWIPTKKGITCSKEHLTELRDAINTAIEEFENLE